MSRSNKIPIRKAWKLEFLNRWRMSLKIFNYD
jgi:hypothetical protein